MDQLVTLQCPKTNVPSSDTRVKLSCLLPTGVPSFYRWWYLSIHFNFFWSSDYSVLKYRRDVLIGYCYSGQLQLLKQTDFRHKLTVFCDMNYTKLERQQSTWKEKNVKRYLLSAVMTADRTNGTDNCPDIYSGQLTITWPTEAAKCTLPTGIHLFARCCAVKTHVLHSTT